MADESRSDHKRKFEDPLSRRATGFSSPSSDAVKASYNSVPPPPDDIQLAKQRAQEIAARLFSDAEAKRPRVDNGAPPPDADKPSSFSSSAGDHSYKPTGLQSQVVGLGPTSYPSYGYQSTSKKIDIPNGRVGVIIGKGGETIKYLQLQSGAKIQVTRDMDAVPNSQTRIVELMGTAEQISKAEQLISDVLEQAEAGGSGLATSRNYMSGQPGSEHFTMKIPNNKVGLIIGKGGETIKNMQARSGAHIQVVPLHLPPGDLSSERTLHIDGTKEQIDSAKQLVDEILNSEVRVRNPSVGGGYQHQGYRPPRPQTNWTPPGQPPMQQSGYGYMQPGAYPGPPPPYGVQPSYAGYPPAPTSAGYSSGWEQMTNNTNQQQAAPGSTYDYYSQQGQGQQQAPAPESAAYNYGQQPPSAYGQQGSYGDASYTQQPGHQLQAYGQDGYSSTYGAQQPQSGYTQPPSNSQPGYDQSQSYGSAPYSAAPSAAQDGSAPTYAPQSGSTQTPTTQQGGPSSQPPVAQQGYSTQQTGSTPPSFPPQGTQPGYSMPPTTQPGYGGQQLPVPSGYGQPPSQTGYGQPSPGQKPPPSPAGYGQPAPYGSPQPPPALSSSYGGAPAPSPGYVSGTQAAYGQQQSHGSVPPPGQAAYGQTTQQSYGEAYGSSGYGAPPAYASSGDNTGGGNVVSAGQSTSTGVKASPQTQA